MTRDRCAITVLAMSAFCLGAGFVVGHLTHQCPEPEQPTHVLTLLPEDTPLRNDWGLTDEKAKPAEEEPGYPDVEIAKIAGGHWPRPRARITGKVTYVKHEADGDWHFRVEDKDGNFVVCEIIPELPMPVGKNHPAVGDRVVAAGVVRFDGEHRWYELHPVTSWEPADAR